jgi:hypothetical protein
MSLAKGYKLAWGEGNCGNDLHPRWKSQEGVETTATARLKNILRSNTAE